jgi:hypothetical protein
MSHSDFAGTVPPATDAQLRFLTSLINESLSLLPKTTKFQAMTADAQTLMTEMVRSALDTLDEKNIGQASALIDAYKESNNRFRADIPAVTPAGAALEPGVYRDVNERIIRVYVGRQSGRMLAAEITADGPEYLGAASRFVTADQRLSVDEAARYGSQFGYCCVCGAELSDPTSVAAGIGPVCSGKY